MKTIRSLLLAAAISVLFGQTLPAQNAAYLEGLFIGSDGTPKMQAQGAEESLEKIHDEFLQAMGLRSRGNSVLPLSTMLGQPAYDRIAALQTSSDSADVAIVAVLGAWEKDPKRTELSAISSVHPDRFTLDYFLNLMLFLPARTMAVFVLAPSQHPFPLDMFQSLKAGIGGGGKYLVVLEPKNQSEFETSVDAFRDFVEKTGEGDAGDRNKDGRLSFAEWMTLFEHVAGAEFRVLSYRITEGADIQLRQLH